MQANRLVGKWPTSLVVPYCSFKPASNSRSSDKCPVNFRFWLAKAWPGWTLWPKGNIKDSILISRLSGRETCGLKISRIHWCGRVIWTERASLKSFVDRKNRKMCPNVSIDHSLRNLISSYCFEFFVQPDWVLVQSKLILVWRMTFLQTEIICRLDAHVRYMFKHGPKAVL